MARDGSPCLRAIAKRDGIPVFEVPPNVGGRFSVLSPVGLLHRMDRDGGNVVRLWAREPEIVQQINEKHENGVYLSGVPLPEKVVATSETPASHQGTLSPRISRAASSEASSSHARSK